MRVPEIPNYPAIDINCCFNVGTIHDRTASNGLRADLPFLLAEYDRLDILASGLCSYGAVSGMGDIRAENALVQERTDQNDGLFQWVVIDPNQPELLRQAEQMLDLPKVLGIRLPHSTRRSSIAQYADEIFALAKAHQAIVMVHPTHVPEVVLFAEKYPQVNVIVPQLCTERLGKECLVESIAGLGNLYTDTSGSPSTMNRCLEFAVSVCGADRVLFGSGGESLAFEKARVLLSALSPVDQQKILLHNALRLFPKLAAWMAHRKGEGE